MPAVSDSPARVLLKVASTGLQPRRQQQPPCGAKEETTTMQTIGTETHNVEDVRQYVDDRADRNVRLLIRAPAG